MASPRRHLAGSLPVGVEQEQNSAAGGQSSLLSWGNEQYAIEGLEVSAQNLDSHHFALTRLEKELSALHSQQLFHPLHT